MNENEKLAYIVDLILGLDDAMLLRFFDFESTKDLDNKIEVLEKYKAGEITRKDEDYYSIMEFYPKDTQWDL